MNLRLAVSLCSLLAIFAGCGGSQPPIGGSGAMTQSRVIAQHAAQGKSWMLPEATHDDLLYVVDSAGGVYIYAYPGGSQVGLLRADASGGLCSDQKGDVFLIDERDSAIVEYPHGGTTPIASLNPDAEPVACSVDPHSGDLASVNEDASSKSSISIFKKAMGKPKKYFDVGTALGLSCTYDDKGNFYATAGTETRGFLIAELPRSSNTFTNISVDAPLEGGNFLQWDGKYVAITSAAPRKPIQVLQISLSGSSGSVVNTTTLQGSVGYFKYFWIQQDTIITPRGAGGWKARKVGLWKYPTGGKAFNEIALPKVRGGQARGITVSLAPSR